MQKSCAKILLMLSVAVFCFHQSTNCYAKDVNVQATTQPDGGLFLKITVSKTVVFSADGIMYNDLSHYRITLVGKGTDWSYRNQEGYFYGQDDIKTNTTGWDLGYVWLDKERKNIYINLYWVSSPDDLKPSDLNGKYKLQP